MRVFHDRLINLEDQQFFEQILRTIVKENFNRDWNTLVIEGIPLLFASFVPTLYPDGDTTRKQYNDIYCELPDMENLKKNAYSQLEEFNNNNPSNKMNLVLFLNAIQHVIRIVRIVSTAYGHALLVGVGGSGRKSLAILSASIAGMELIQIDAKNWVEEL